MQFKRKLINQTCKNGKKPNFGSDFGLFWPKFDLKTFFVGFTSSSCYTLLQAITVCNVKENWLTRLEKMAKNLVFWPKFGPQRFFFHEFYIWKMLEIVANYHWMLFQGKLMNQIWENGKKNKSQTQFWPKKFFCGFCLY